MKRFFGLMPSSEVKKEEYFKDKDGFRIRIQAGDNGWTIMWSDNSTTFKDIESSTEENFSKAYEVATNYVGKLTKYNRNICELEIND